MTAYTPTPIYDRLIMSPNNITVKLSWESQTSSWYDSCYIIVWHKAIIRHDISLNWRVQNTPEGRNASWCQFPRLWHELRWSKVPPKWLFVPICAVISMINSLKLLLKCLKEGYNSASLNYFQRVQFKVTKSWICWVKPPGESVQRGSYTMYFRVGILSGDVQTWASGNY